MKVKSKQIFPARERMSPAENILKVQNLLKFPLELHFWKIK